MPVLTIDRSACFGNNVVISVTTVLVLLPGVGSVMPAGNLTVATFTRLPVPVAGATALIVTVTLPPGGKVVTVPATLLLVTVLGAGQTAPNDGAPHVAVTAVKPAGNTSA